MDEINQLILFTSIQNQEGSRNALDIALQHIGKGNQFNPNKAHKFLTAIQDNLSSKQSSPKSKFYTLMILQLLSENTENKQILSILSSHNILKYLSLQAQQIDPKKSISQKGKNLFPDKSLGNDYIRLILESLKFWSQKYPKSKKQNKPTKLKLAYAQLQEMNIVLPTDYKFYGKRQNSKTSVIASQQMIGKSTSPRTAQTSKGSGNYDKKLAHNIQTIKVYKQAIGQQGAEQLCHTYHATFKKQNENSIKIINQITNNQQQSKSSQKILNTVFLLQSFYDEQNRSYEQFILNNRDFYSYFQNMSMKCEELLQQLGEGPVNQPISNRGIAKREQTYMNPSNFKTNNPIVSSGGDSNKNLATKFMEKLNQQSTRSPRVGFKAIKEQLSNDKSIKRSKRSTSGLKKSSVSKFGKSMSKSRIAQIFSNPPNQNPRQKRYEGQLIQTNRQIQNVMTAITKNQGIRRFITCNFKTKNPLFQNTHLQIGLKSQPIYEQINQFKVMIGLELYIGNKTQHMIKNMSIDYKGNEQVLLYGNPRTIDSILQSGIQNKHQLIVVPINNQFPLIKMYLKYTINGETTYQTIILPNSMLKLAHYRSLEKKQFVQFWNNSKIIKTKQFKLTRYISPDSLNKYITSLQELSSYQQFIVKGSQSDYQLGCFVVLKQQFEGVLRISIRPNINAVIQIGIVDINDQAYQSFVFYAQTLQAILTHADHNS